MSKKDKQKGGKSAAPASAAPAGAPVVEASPVIIKVLKKDAKYRGAREAWYQRLVEHDGKPLQTFYASCQSQPPKLTKAGTAEDPKGWFSWFKRQGVADTAAIEQKAAA